jgi:hypothetical protein
VGLLNWIFDFYQHHKIDQATREMERTRAEMASVRNDRGAIDAARLERALGELALATKTMQRMLVEKGVCSLAEFQRKLELVDREDGQADGRSPV